MRQKKITKSLSLPFLLLNLVIMTACPNNESRNNAPPIVVQQQNPPIPGPGNPGNPGNPGGPGNPIDPNNPYGPGPLVFKDFDCVLEAYRQRPRKFLGIKYIDFDPIPRTVFKISFIEGAGSAPFYLRTRFFGLDSGQFGEIKMEYKPAGGNKKSDRLIITDKGLNGIIKVIQEGFAGSEVSLEGFSDSETDDMRIFVACQGSPHSRFKNEESPAAKTNLVCLGTSYTATSSREDVNVTIPLSSIQPGEVFAISSAVSAELDTSLKKITFTGSLDLERNALITTTSSLKSSARFYIRDIAKKHNSFANIDIICNLE